MCFKLIATISAHVNVTFQSATYGFTPQFLAISASVLNSIVCLCIKTSEHDYYFPEVNQLLEC